MIRVKNMTPGLISVDVPSEHQQDARDPVAELLASVDLSHDISPGDALKTLLGLELAKRSEAKLAQDLAQASIRRARDTVDLWPSFQGEDEPTKVNDVPEDRWRRIERMPTIAARIACGDLRVVGYPATGCPF